MIEPHLTNIIIFFWLIGLLSLSRSHVYLILKKKKKILYDDDEIIKCELHCN